MKSRILICVLLAIVVTGICGCAGMSRQTAKDEKAAGQLTLCDVPAPARTMIEILTTGGKILKLEKEEEGGKVIYDIEGIVRGKYVEFDIAENGVVMTAQQSITFKMLPEPVQTAVINYFGSKKGLKPHREVEEGKIFYEVEGKKDNTPVALKLDDTGKIVEEEK